MTTTMSNSKQQQTPALIEKMSAGLDARYRKPHPKRKEIRSAVQLAKAEYNASRHALGKAQAKARKAQKHQAFKRGEHEFDSFMCDDEIVAEQQTLVAEEQFFGLSTAADKIGEAADRVAQSTERLMNAASSSVEGVNSFFTQNKTSMVAHLVLVLASIANNPSIYTIILEILKIIVSYTSIISDLPSYLCSIWPAIEKMIRWTLGKTPTQGSTNGGLVADQQSLQDFVPDSQFWATSGALAAGVGTIVGASLLATTQTNVTGMAYNAYRRATENYLTKKLTDGADGFFCAVFDSIKSAMCSFIPEGTFYPKFEALFRAEKLDPVSFVSRVTHLTDPLRRDEMLEKDSTAVELNDLVAISKRLIDGFMKKELSSKFEQVAFIHRAIEKLLSFAAEYQVAHQEKVRGTPFVVCIFSKPGVGKSLMTNAIVQNLMAKEHGNEHEWNGRTYYRSAADAYHTNMRDQDVYCVDDWGQSRTSTPQNDEFRDFIAIVSSVPFSPPQAAIGDKGRPFCAKLVLTTTNVPYPKPTQIAEADAILRRRNFVWEMSVLDDTRSMEDPFRYGFQRFSPMEKIPISQGIITFDHFIMTMIPAYNAWHNKNAELKQVGFVPFPSPNMIGNPSPGSNEVSRLVTSPKTLDVPYLFATQESGEAFVPRLFAHEAPELPPSENIFDEFVPPPIIPMTSSQAHINGGIYLDEGEEFFHFGRCECCGARSCAQGGAPDCPILCVYNPDEARSNWSLVRCYQMWDYMERFNREHETSKLHFCWTRHVVIYSELDDLSWTHTEFSYIDDHTNVYVHNCFYYNMLDEGYEGDFAQYMIQHREDRANVGVEEPYLRPWELPGWGEPSWDEPEEEEMDWDIIAEPQSGDAIPMPEPTAPLPDTPEVAAISEELQEARARDEKSILEKLLEYVKDVDVKFIAVKAVLAFGTILIGMKALRMASTFVGKPQTTVKVVDTRKTEEGIEMVLESVEPSLKEVARNVLRTALYSFFAKGMYDTFAGPVMGVAQEIGVFEGGASAYGELKTIKGIKRQNMKFAKALTNVIEKEIVASGAIAITDTPPTIIGELQGCTDLNGLDLIQTSIGPNNLFTLSRAPGLGETSGASVKGVGLTGGLVLIPAHFLPKEPTVLDSVLKVKQRVVSLSIDYRKAKIIHNGDEPMDLALIELDHNVERFRTITKHFVRENQLKKLTRFKSMWIKHQAEAGGFFVSSNYIDTISITENGEGAVRYGPPGAPDHLLLDGYAYKIPTNRGDCGAILMALDSSLQGRICGIHVAGISSQERGFATAITYECLMDNINKHFPNLNQGSTIEADTQLLVEEPVEQQVDKAIFAPQGETEFIGVVRPAVAQRLAKKTDIVESRLHDKVFPHTKVPAVMSPSDPRIDYTKTPENYTSPLQQAGEKYAVQTTPFNSEYIDIACEIIYEHLAKNQINGMTMRDLTYDEVLNGVPNAGYAGMDMSTSPGMPYKTLRPPMSPGKHIYYKQGPDGKYVRNTEARVKGVCPVEIADRDTNAWREAAISGKDVPLQFNTECLKQETIDKEKAAMGKTRMFSISPLPITFLYREKFGAALAFFNQNPTNLPSAVGINPMGGDWTLLAKRLLKHGDAFIAGDYKQWDGKLQGAVMAAAVEKIINRLYSRDGPCEESNRVRMRLIDYAIHTNTLLANTLVRKHQGNPSGIPITSDLNSLCNWIYMLVAFQYLKADHSCENCGNITPQQYHSYVEPSFYGDDHVLGCHPRVRCFYTFNTIQKLFTSMGIGYTDALKKGGQSPDFQTLAETSYLKRMFVKTETGRYLAPLDLNSIKDQINWVKESNDPTAALLQNVESAMREFMMHGENAYNEAASRIRKGLEDLQKEDLETTSETFSVPVFSFTETYNQWIHNCF